VALQFVGDVVVSLVQSAPEVGLSGAFSGKRPPRLSTDPTFLEFFGIVGGLGWVLAGSIFCAMYLYQQKLESYVATQSPARAVIVSAKRDGEFTDALLNYERRTASGPVACWNAPMRFEGWSQDFEVGKTVEVYPQPGSCYRPILRSSIGTPETTLKTSLIAFPIGIGVFGLGYSSFRRRQRKMYKAASSPGTSVRPYFHRETAGGDLGFSGIHRPGRDSFFGSPDAHQQILGPYRAWL